MELRGRGRDGGDKAGFRCLNRSDLGLGAEEADSFADPMRQETWELWEWLPL